MDLSTNTIYIIKHINDILIFGGVFCGMKYIRSWEKESFPYGFQTRS